MKDRLESIALGAIAFVILLGVIYVIRVLPYGNDWRCVFAECRIQK